MARVSEQLSDDHAALDRVLKQLQAALRASDLRTAHDKLDLFWARLAVHIRAEHLHLFPAVLSRLENGAQKIVEQLRRDHEFFMHELARSVEMTRKLVTIVDQSIVQEGLDEITDMIVKIDQRLSKHNEVEESQIYHWATTALSFEEQAKLAEQITAELQKRPSRFTENTWMHVDDHVNAV